MPPWHPATYMYTEKKNVKKKNRGLRFTKELRFATKFIKYLILKKNIFNVH